MFVCYVISIAVLLCDRDAPGPRPPSIVGVWRIDKIDSNTFEEFSRVAITDGLVLEFKEKQAILRNKNGILRHYDYKVDEAKAPRQIDILHGDRMYGGVYEITDATLRMCFPAQLGGKRPEELSVSKERSVITLTRVRMEK